jgi:hypothetical protein
MRTIFCQWLGWHFPCDRTLVKVTCRRCGALRVEWI